MTTQARPPRPRTSRSTPLRSLAAAAVLAAALPLLAPPADAATTKNCPRAVVDRAADVTYVARNWKVARGISCTRARQLVQVTYGSGPLKAYRTTFPFANDSGRPTYFVKGGWRCSNGAGGAGCWNAKRPRYNVISTGGSQRQAITVTVDLG